MKNENYRVDPKDLTAKEAAQFLNISVRYLHLIKCKKLDTANGKRIRYVNEGKRVLFPIEELERYRRERNTEQWQ